MTSPAKTLIRVSLIALALVAATVHARPAAAATPCWKTLLNDWYDGRIDGTYQEHCYKDALKHLPTDVSTYSSAREDILRALQSARARAGHRLGPNALIVPPPTKGGRKAGKGLSGVASNLNPSGPLSLPVPLLVLGSLGILLVGAGGIGLAVKQVQARRTGR